MKNLNTMGISHKSTRQSSIAQQIQYARHVKEPFSDGDILDLQDAFLSNGLHYIKVDDAHSGRSLINLFLSSLNYYQNISCLSMSSISLDSSIADLYAELMIGGYLDANALTQELEYFFLEHFYYDFMWVEASKDLIESSWATDFFQQVIHFKLDQLISILIVSYKS